MPTYAALWFKNKSLIYRQRQSTATHCNTLQHTAIHFVQLRHKYVPTYAAPWLKKNHHLAKMSERCNTLQHTTTHCNALREFKTQLSADVGRFVTTKNKSIIYQKHQSTATHCNTMRHNATHFVKLKHNYMPMYAAPNSKKILQLSKTSEHCNTQQHTLQHTATHFVQLRVYSLHYTCIHFITFTHLITHV